MHYLFEEGTYLTYTDQAPILVLPVTHHAASEKILISLGLSFLHCKMETNTYMSLGCKITELSWYSIHDSTQCLLVFLLGCAR